MTCEKRQQAKEESTKQATTQAAWEITIHNNACSNGSLPTGASLHCAYCGRQSTQIIRQPYSYGIKVLNIPGMTCTVRDKNKGAM